VKTSKRNRISEIFYNCVLTNRHWEDYQIRKRACKKGEMERKTQIAPKEN